MTCIRFVLSLRNLFIDAKSFTPQIISVANDIFNTVVVVRTGVLLVVCAIKQGPRLKAKSICIMRLSDCHHTTRSTFNCCIEFFIVGHQVLCGASHYSFCHLPDLIFTEHQKIFIWCCCCFLVHFFLLFNICLNVVITINSTIWLIWAFKSCHCSSTLIYSILAHHVLYCPSNPRVLAIWHIAPCHVHDPLHGLFKRGRTPTSSLITNAVTCKKLRRTTCESCTICAVVDVCCCHILNFCFQTLYSDFSV